MAGEWEDVEETMVSSATADLESGDDVGPLLAAFAGRQLLFLAYLRPFQKGHYHDPLIELLALALPLHADRLGLSTGGRAWSFDDPIPPVTEGADLRQRVLVCSFVDSFVEPSRQWSAVYPFELVKGRVSWGEPQRAEGGEGFIITALAVAARREAHLTASDDEIAKQAARCDRLGHELYLAPEVAERLCGPTHR